MQMSAALAAFQLFSFSVFSFSLLDPAVDFTTKARRGMEKEMHMSAALAALQHFSISAFLWRFRVCGGIFH
jgi:hypothetical protein